MPRIEFARAGRQAIETLDRSLDASQHEDPLRSVTVITPGSYSALSLRKSLARSPTRPGLVNVRFQTLRSVAELLGAPRLVGSFAGPLTSLREAAAINAVLENASGTLQAVAHHRATQQALAATLRELRHASNDTLRRITLAGATHAELARLATRYQRCTAAYYDADDMLDAAVAGLEDIADSARRNSTSAAGDPISALGLFIVFAPDQLPAAHVRLVTALARLKICDIVFTLTGEVDSDEPMRALAAELSVHLGKPIDNTAGAPLTPPFGTSIVHAPEPDDEVRAVIRGIFERLERGTPLHRVAVLYRNADQYAGLLHDHLDAAGLPWNGPSHRTLAQSVSGRTLLGMLALPQSDYQREDVMAWLSGAPVRATRKGPIVAATRWENLACRAGIVGGKSNWTTGLTLLEQRRRADVERYRSDSSNGSNGSHPAFRQACADLAEIERLQRFIAELVTIEDVANATDWRTLSTTLRHLLERYLEPRDAQTPGGTDHHDGHAWPDIELHAHDAVLRALDGLAVLDDELRDANGQQQAAPPPTLQYLKDALGLALEQPQRSVGRFGDGVFVGSLSQAAGTTFDTVFIVGMADGTFPPRPRDDAIFPETLRAVVGLSSPSRDRQRRARREYLNALCAAPERVLSFARVDTHARHEQHRSRWLTETHTVLAGAPRMGKDFSADRDKPWFHTIDSFEHGISEASTPGSPQEASIHALLHWQRTISSAARAPAASAMPPTLDDPILERAYTTIINRAQHHANAFTGIVGPLPDFVADRVWSATALERYATCPFRYLLGDILRLTELDRPDERETIDPRERGTLIHEILRQFIDAMPQRSSPNQPWSPDERQAIHDIADSECAAVAKRGGTGRPLTWKLQRRRLHRELDVVLDTDEEVRSTLGLVPSALELAFGFGGSGPQHTSADLIAASAPLQLPIDGHGTVTFRGTIDRVDTTIDRSRVAIWDYKTGSSTARGDLTTDPVSGGTQLQPALYGLAARRLGQSVPVDAGYWYTPRRGVDNAIVRITIDDVVVERLRSVLGVVLTNIAAGNFPAFPKTANNRHTNCQYCEFDLICPTDRNRRWQQIRNHDPISELAELIDPDPIPS